MATEHSTLLLIVTHQNIELEALKYSKKLGSQWSRIQLNNKSTVKIDLSQVKTLTAVTDLPTVCMCVTSPYFHSVTSTSALFL